MEITGALVLFIFKEICVKYAMYVHPRDFVYDCGLSITKFSQNTQVWSAWICLMFSF